jgi:signal transduction histidine kinase
VQDDHDDDIARLQQLAGLGELAAGVTHETRNVLTGIVGFIQLAKQRHATTDAARRHFDLIEREALRAAEILQQFLQLTHEEADVERAELVDIAQVVAEIEGASVYQANLRGVELLTRVDGAPVRLHMRRAALLQVLLNLVLNAVHATPVGGRVEVVANVGERELALFVRDTGSGVPAELRERIFAPFFTTKPRGEGTGLGLAVSRRLVEAAGGTLTYQSAPGGGAMFVIQLPHLELA